MQTIELTDGGIILYEAGFLPPDVADRYFVDLRDTAAWEQKKAAFGQLQPRLTASYGDEGVTYFYSGTENPALPWSATLGSLREIIYRLRRGRWLGQSRAARIGFGDYVLSRRCPGRRTTGASLAGGTYSQSTRQTRPASAPATTCSGRLFPAG